MKSILCSMTLTLVILGNVPTMSLANEPRDLVGLWKNEMHDPLTGGWRTLSWFTVGLRGGQLVMAGVDFSVDPDASLPSAFGNVRVSHDQWSFVTRVDGRTFQFDLRKASPTHYEGRFSINGQRQPQARRLVKIDGSQLRTELDRLLTRLAVARVATEQLIAMSRQNQQYWQERAERVRDARIGTGALESYYNILATGKAGGQTIRLQQIHEQIRAATAARDRLAD